MIKKVATVFLTLGFAFNVWADVNVESIRYEDSAVVGGGRPPPPVRSSSEYIRFA